MVVLVDGKIVQELPGVLRQGVGARPGDGQRHPRGDREVSRRSRCATRSSTTATSTEKWAVRINNNGEFIHENALTAPYLGKANVSHGCVNMGVGDAEDYYNSAIYGDPVEVTNTGVPMTEADDIYDWIYSFEDWQKLSAL